MKQDWNQRKHEIGSALRNAQYLPAEENPEVYTEIVNSLGLRDQRDFCILICIVRDASMQARREERQTTPLDMFLDWLECVRR